MFLVKAAVIVAIGLFVAAYGADHVAAAMNIPVNSAPITVLAVAIEVVFNVAVYLVLRRRDARS
jgi:hypothetical protein